MSRELDTPGPTTSPPDETGTRRAARPSAWQVGPPLLVAAAIGAGAAHVALTDPEASILPPCPIRTLTGLWCPGCGLTRATHHLLHGHFAEAWSYHALVAPVLAGLAALWWVWWRVATGHGVPRVVRSVPVAAYVAAGLALAIFTVARNLTGHTVPGTV